MEKIQLSRRDFLKISAAAGGGLLVGFSLHGCEGNATPDSPNDAAAAPTVFDPNAWISIGTDDVVTLRVGSSEMGQGVMTAICMLIAEELDADWSMRAEFAPADSAYYNPIMGKQATGGSNTIRAFWKPMRTAGAAAREILVQAASQQWQVNLSECRAHNGAVVHEPSKRSVRFGALAEAAAKLPVPDAVFLKDADEFVLLGRPRPRLDTPAKTDGSAVFGIDVQLPGLLTATVARCPVLGGSVKSFEAENALAVPGVKQVVQISSGIAVIAEHFWAAKKGRDALQVDWDEGPNRALDSASIFARFADALTKPAVIERADGHIEEGLKSAARTLQAAYTVPYQAHACMEPMNASADVRGRHCAVYAPTQSQTATQNVAMQITGLRREQVKVHTTFLGGGFGRRAETDFIAEAVECSKAAGRPVKVIWTREDDIMHDQYRPATANILRGGVDANGRITAWEHRIAGPSILARVYPDSTKEGRDGTSTEGAKNIPYDIKHVFVSYAMVNPAVPVGFWRSVGSSQNAYITECFFDELVRLARRDPLEARLELLKEHPRHSAVLQLAADQASWRTALPAGRARGIAVAEAFGSFTAQVAEVSIERGRVRVHRVTCAVDCGMTVNPDTIRAQMESGIVYGLTAALKGAITIKAGRVVQKNFDDYPLLRIDECPSIDIHIVNSREAPGGVGEPGVPPIAPAVANAVFALTGKPVRSLPIRLAG